MGVLEAHPFLEEEIFLAGSTAHQNLDGFSEYLDQSATIMVSEPVSSRSESPGPDFLSLQTPGGLISEHLQSEDTSTEVLYDSTSTNPFQQLYAETLETDTWGMDGIEPGRLDSAMSTGSGVEDDWTIFMKESGLV